MNSDREFPRLITKNNTLHSLTGNGVAWAAREDSSVRSLAAACSLTLQYHDRDAARAFSAPAFHSDSGKPQSRLLPGLFA